MKYIQIDKREFKLSVKEAVILGSKIGNLWDILIDDMFWGRASYNGNKLVLTKWKRTVWRDINILFDNTQWIEDLIQELDFKN